VSARPKITVAVPFPVHPPVGGGQRRVSEVYRHMAFDFDVELVTIASSDAEPADIEIAPGLREIRIPKSAAQQAEETRLEQEVGGIPVGDVGIRLFGVHTPEYARRLTRSMDDADLVVASHPYAVAAVPDALHRHLLVYEAHNVEYLLKKEVFHAAGATGERLAETVRRLEADVCRAAQLIFCCSETDREELRRLYAVDPTPVVVDHAHQTDILGPRPIAQRTALAAGEEELHVRRDAGDVEYQLGGVEVGRVPASHEQGDRLAIEAELDLHRLPRLG